MKTFDNTIKYYELLMSYKDTSKYQLYTLPEGYHFEYYKKGDELDWINIHLSSGEFTSVKKGLKYFHDFYDNFINELNKRCIFIVDDKTNEKIGTATISLLKESEYDCDAAVDWLAIKKDYQGKKLSKPLISKLLALANELGHKKIILHTQTTTWLAAKLYLDFGFEPLNTNDLIGWRILKTLTNHPKLKEFASLAEVDIYDKRIIEIEKQLCQIYHTDNFNYSVWYKNNLHNVYVYINGLSEEYEYFEENSNIKLKKISSINKHEMKLNNVPFIMIKNGTKTIELRLNDEKRQLLKKNDLIEFTNRETLEKIIVEIEELYKYPSFVELYKQFDKISLGYKENEKADPKDMEKHYSKEEQLKYGVLGIKIKNIIQY